MPCKLSVKLAKAGTPVAFRLIACPSASDALTLRVAEAPSATVRSAIAASTTGRLVLLTLMVKFCVADEAGLSTVAVTDAG